MSRLIIFIPSGETEPVTVRIEHAPDLPVPGIWNVVTNTVYLRTELWTGFPSGDPFRQRRIFDQLLKVSDELT
ncbi:MAG: hypothetical protein H0X41_13310 [Chitinophagaceae bacterium]|nr:hypothetical protein [Chitinophagaceae bacterium]